MVTRGENDAWMDGKGTMARGKAGSFHIWKADPAGDTGSDVGLVLATADHLCLSNKSGLTNQLRWRC